jgi:hypothetical protein
MLLTQDTTTIIIGNHTNAATLNAELIRKAPPPSSVMYKSAFNNHTKRISSPDTHVGNNRRNALFTTDENNGSIFFFADKYPDMVKNANI